MRGAAQQLPSPMNTVFMEISIGMERDPTESLGVRARIAFRKHGDIPAQLCELLCDLFSLLGRQDSAAQLRALELAQCRLNSALECLQREKKEQCRVYQTIGICAGIALAVILI